MIPGEGRAPEARVPDQPGAAWTGPFCIKQELHDPAFLFYFIYRLLDYPRVCGGHQ